MKSLKNINPVNYMKSSTLLFFIIFSANIMLAACRNQEPEIPDPKIEVKYQSDNPVSDMVLIYDGGQHRKPWTIERLRPYIFRENGGKTDFLFDGFLFLEIFDSVKNIEYSPGYGKKSSQKADWETLLDTYFNDRKSFGALENILDSLARAGKVPLRKRKVVISIPTPPNTFTAWGVLNGKSLDFNKIDDQLAAAAWFADEVLVRWKAKNYNHLELTGFYWVAESVSSYENLMKLTSQNLQLKGKKFYWIPYYNATGGHRWNELGFDYAYEQPNYFFNTKIPYSRLDDACAFAAKNGLALEMEFDNRITQTIFRTRFDDYVKAFTDHKIWELQPVAYYEGGGAWFELAGTSSPELKKLHQTLGDIIAARQKKADERSKK
jgi:hypothetical protein